MDTKKQLFGCIERIEKLFFYDTLVLLDCVLEDDTEDPVYSANTVYHRLEDCLLFQNLYFKDNIQSVLDFLEFYGYLEKDVHLLMEKIDKENQRNNFKINCNQSDQNK